MNEDRVRLTVEDRVAHLRLNRPEARNAIDAKMGEALAEAVDAVEANESVRALLITGEGPSFCVGGDLKYLTTRMDALAAEFRTMIGLWHTTLTRLHALRIPVVTAVHGGTAGGGLGLVWCADYVVASETTKIASGFVDLGLSGDGGSSWHLPRLVGLRRAQEMLLDNRVVDAATALDWGLLTKVVPHDQLASVATATVARFASRSLTAIGHQKELLRTSIAPAYATQLQAELEAMVDGASKADVRSGIPAFVGKVAPAFPDGPLARGRR